MLHHLKTWLFARKVWDAFSGEGKDLKPGGRVYVLWELMEKSKPERSCLWIRPLLHYLGSAGKRQPERQCFW